MTIKCSECQKDIIDEEKFHHGLKKLCEDCYIAILIPRRRKTHWQYLRSIKTEYLRPEKKTQKKVPHKDQKFRSGAPSQDPSKSKAK